MKKLAKKAIGKNMSKHKGVIDMMFKKGDKVRIKAIGKYNGMCGRIVDSFGDENHSTYKVDVMTSTETTYNLDNVVFAEEHLEKVEDVLPKETVNNAVDEDWEPSLGGQYARWALAKSYKQKLFDLLNLQEAKGIRKYGVPLEQNKTLTTDQRIAHLQEELVDGLYYCEHLRDALGSDGITANDYQRAALRTAQIDKYSPDDLLQNGVMGLCGEAGEVIDIVKKCMFQGHPLDKKKLALEISDVLWYAAVSAYAIGYPLSEIMEMNIEKLKERFPDGFDKARSINRKEYKTEGRDSEEISSDVPGEGKPEAGSVRNDN